MPLLFSESISILAVMKGEQLIEWNFPGHEGHESLSSLHVFDVKLLGVEKWEKLTYIAPHSNVFHMWLLDTWQSEATS